MVNVVKFSQFADAGNMPNSAVTVGLSGGANARFTNSWVFYPSGNTAARPVSPTAQLRFNTETNAYEYWDGLEWLTVSSSGGASLTNEDVTVNTITMAPNFSYTINAPSVCTLTLPLVASIGDVIQITGNSAGGWIIAQTASQIIHILGTSSTVGVTGSVGSTNARDALSIKCVVANTTWNLQASSSAIFTIL